jgi:hypothetical protein
MEEPKPGHRGRRPRRDDGLRRLGVYHGTSSTALLRRITSALDAPYLLVVHDGRIWTLYGFRPCPALDAQGRRYAGLLGDRRVGGTTQLPPRLFADMVAATLRSEPRAS